MTGLGRVLLIDPVCISERGHNLPLLLEYREALQDLLGHEIEAHVAAQLPEHLRVQHNLFGSIPFPYGHITQLVKNLNLPAGTLELPRGELARALRGLAASNEPTLLVFPYADYESVMGLREALVDLAEPHRVTVALRFIGVMEFTVPPHVNALKELSGAVRDIKSAGYRVSLAAEAAPLAALLSTSLDEVVDLVPPFAPTWPRATPPASSLRPDGPFVYCPGSGRDDKGFLDLPLLIARFRQSFPGSSLTFVCQEPAPSRDEALHDAQIRLQAIPGVRVLPSLVATSEMTDLYQSAEFVLLPYSQGTYEFRSSASLADAFAAQTPVLTLAGTGLEPYVLYYGVGKISPDLQTLVADCAAMQSTGRGAWAGRCRAALARYDRDSLVAWSRWLHSEPAA